MDVPFYQNHRIPFYISTLGFYLLSIIRFRDTLIIPTTDRDDDDDDDERDLLPSSVIPTKIASKINPIYFDSINENYIIYLIKRASTFTPVFRSFFFNHLNLSCPFLHKLPFENQFRSIRNLRLRSLYEELIDKRAFLTLKQRCRLLIKQSINQYPLDITKLVQLPITLQNYLSFDLLNPNFVQLTFKQLNESEGRIKPTFFDELQFHEHNDEQINGHHDWEDQVPEEMEDDGDEDDNDQPVRTKSFRRYTNLFIILRMNTMMPMLIYSMKKVSIQIITTMMTIGETRIAFKSDFVCVCI